MKSRLSVLASTQTSPSRVLLRDLFPALSLHLVNLCADYTFHQDYWQGQRHRNIKCCLCHGVLQRRKTMDADRRSVDTCSHVIWNTVKLFECYFLSYLMAKLALNFLGVMMFYIIFFFYWRVSADSYYYASFSLSKTVLISIRGMPETPQSGV